jgi:galactokinase
VVSENARVLATAAALEAGDLDELGRLFAASHASLRDHFEVSSPALDTMVDVARAIPGVVAARMTGAGLGGCTVNLVLADAVPALQAAVSREYDGPARPRLSRGDRGRGGAARHGLTRPGAHAAPPGGGSPAGGASGGGQLEGRFTPA